MPITPTKTTPLTLDGVSYTTIISVKRAFQEKRKKYAHGDTIEQDNPDFRFMFDLFCNHYSKFQTWRNVVRFKIGPNIRFPTNPNDYSPYVEYDDGSVEDWSFNTCAEGRGSSSEDKLTEAMRNSIQPQIYTFKLTTTDIRQCRQCQSMDHLHIDHITAFDTIKRQFFAENPTLTIPQVFARGDRDEVVFADADSAFAEQWNQYHQQHATYQFLCKTHNCSKGNRAETTTAPVYKCLLRPIKR
jgi:hypothetical protein